MPLLTLALWFLCLFGALAMVARPATRTEHLMLSAGVAISVAWTHWLPVSAGWIAVAVTLAATWALLRPMSVRVAYAVAGILGGFAASIIVAQGLSILVAVPVILILLLVAAGLTQRASFAPTSVREQALLSIALIGPCIAAVPGISAGWDSAIALNRTLSSATAQTVPAWTWQFALCALLIGALRGGWWRR